MQPPSSGADPYYPPTSGVPGPPPASNSTFGTGTSTFGATPPEAYGPPQPGAYGLPQPGAPRPGPYGTLPQPGPHGAQPGAFGASPPGAFGAPGGGFGAPAPPRRTRVVPIVLGIVVALVVVGAGCFTAGYLVGKQRAESTTAAGPSAAAPSAAAPSAAAPSAAAPSVAAPSAPAAGAPSGGAPSGSSRPDGVVGKWTGTYTCNQGETGLTLTIGGPGTALTATFAFAPTPGNPTAKKGSYRMSGSVTGGVLRLTGTEWIDRPAGYGMVDLTSTAITATTIQGTVDSSGCTNFSLKRA